ncbi:MAG: hypothetical protein NZL87_06115, partial [Thermomicrobium sp.]|nr:hypothetical protein [Thermomicrobium sp.]
HLAREQERLALSALTQELERRLPTLFCRYLAQLRWGVPGVFYDEFIAQAASEELVERWLAPDLVVTGILRAGGSTVPIVVQLAVVPEVDETVLDRVSAGAALLAAAVGPVIPAVAALRPGDASEAARTRGVLVVSARSVQNWEQAVARWLTER